MKISVALMTIAALASAPSFAEDRTDPLALQALRNFAICAVQRTPEGAEKLLSFDIDSQDYHDGLSRYAKGHDYCAPGSRLGFSGILFAGDLAEALVASRYQGGASLAAAAAQPEPPARTVMEGIGICVARQRPDAVRALIATDPGSPQELKALQGTGDVLPACTPKGKPLKINKPAIRAMYALGAYRLLTATPAHGG